MTPDEWLADFEAKTAELQRNAAAFRRNLESAGTTVTTEDRSVTVTVASNGALLDLKIEGNAELAGKILALVRSAREQAATNVLDEFRQVTGSHANELDTDVSVPALPEQPRKAAQPENEDFSEKTVYRKESW
ncbi:YbaB/EbfC family nucleoid-associated protein [Lentzea sp. NEAU-D13]|uniref:YbaB/EbfC family nucleoid-associated protein n=1 Tax=Lentzea alba TaxID=2714351 RepID=A0A7C9RNI0_9PSEU|nr:YbaB/EbfC family nucleoid-associated protein [Lentzea alba]NGY58844.1 YbaB/EbfC family nucleoid-associated protein [Lentzea alba]